MPSGRASNPIAETAGEIAYLRGPGVAPALLKNIVHQRLAQRYKWGQLILFVIAVGWVLLFLLRHHPVVSGTEANIVFGSVLFIGSMINACYFPSQKTSAAATRFATPVAAALGVGAVVTCARAALIDTDIHVNFGCLTVHWVFNFVNAWLWSAGAVMVIRGHGTWRVGRMVLALDGATVIIATLAMRLMGPPPRYPVGTFLDALARASITPLVAFTFSPPRRLQLAALANRHGWNHVTVSLDHVTTSPTSPRRHSNDPSQHWLDALVWPLASVLPASAGRRLSGGRSRRDD